MPGWRLRILDGSHLAATQRRLSALWQVSAGPLPGLALVVFDMAARMMSEVVLCEDGHAQERSLTAQILALVVRGDCWVADRNFCTQSILFGILSRDGAFVIRQHASLPGEAVGSRRACGRCESGALFEQRFRLSFEGEIRGVRRVTLVLDALLGRDVRLVLEAIPLGTGFLGPRLCLRIIRRSIRAAIALSKAAAAGIDSCCHGFQSSGAIRSSMVPTASRPNCAM